MRARQRRFDCRANARRRAAPQPAPVMEFFEVFEQSILDLQGAMSAGA